MRHVAALRRRDHGECAQCTLVFDKFHIVRHLIEAVDKVRHEKGILAYFELRITNASVEGLKNKAKVVSHRTYGFKTAKTFITNLYLSLRKLPMPETTHRFV